MIDAVAMLTPIIISVSVMLVFVLILLVAVGDMVQIGRRKQSRPTRKGLTVIVLAEHVESLERCLRSLTKAPVGRHDIVVIDVSRGDRQAIRRVAKAKKRTVVYRPRIRHDLEGLLRLAYARSQKADTVMIAYDSVCFAAKSTNNPAVAELLESSTRPIRLRVVPTESGFAGVMLALREGAVGLVESGLNVLKVRRPAVVHGRAYIMPADTIKKAQPFAKGWRYHTHAPQILSGDAAIVSIAGIRDLTNWAAFGLLVCAGYVMVVVSIERNSPDAFMFVWFLISIGSVAIILFDPFLRVAQKIRSIACIGFMPILVLVAVVVKMNRL